ncbi:peroxisomal leader peptide-processing protease-like [Antedon mediterranea]|uniref:peroxisomal leader peptide-processing protease-like n=1 Tax=Antedon mediterranea TaxID=105859 RepID=UPI003AF668EC
MQCDENCIVLVDRLESSLSLISADSSSNFPSNSQSGILVDYENGFVITSAVLFSSKIDKQKLANNLIKCSKDFETIKITVILQNKCCKNDQKEFISVAGKLMLIWSCMEFQNVMTTHFSERDGWQFEKYQENEILKERSKNSLIEPVSLKSEFEENENINLLFWFALIKLDYNEKIKRFGNQVTHYYPSVNLRQGDALLASGTPFGALCPPVFMNSVSMGIVSNLAGKKNTLIMTDARVMPGSEGAGVYVLPHGDINKRKLAAMIVSPVSWKSDEWIGLTLAVSISALLDSLQTHLQLPHNLLMPAVDAEVNQACWTSEIMNAINSVVYVQVGSIWGSGVIIDGVKGYVLTCRHVVRSSKRGVRIFSRYPSPRWLAADVVFSTCPSSPLDLALLKLQNCPKGLPAVKTSTDASKGQRVIAVGHALFSFELQNQPSVTSGVVSNTVTYKDELVMIQSTCAVHGGASGGALLCAETGQFIGIIASNSRDIENNASFPHVNFSIPTAMFWFPITSYISSKDSSVLESLTKTEVEIKHLWQLDASKINIMSKL